MIETLLSVASAISKPLSDLYDLGKGGLKSKSNKWKAAKNINSLYSKISTVQKVKTIWQIDKEVNLKSFYYPSRLIVDNKEVPVNSISKIPDDGNIVIQGTVGQGKSIFMRYMCSQELRQGKTIPIFFELRKIQENESIKSHILLILDELGFDDPEEVFSRAATTGLMTLFLDGFDEVDPDRIMPLISELEHFAKKYDSLKILVSSRPDSGIEKSTFFRVYKICPLNVNDHPGFLRRLLKDTELENIILKAINSNNTQIKSLLTTPLMMTLLVITYKAEQEIPSQASDFYENLFQILLSRHDKTKPGYSRHRACVDTADKQLQEIFEAFCFLTTKKSLIALSLDEAHNFSKQASELVGIPCKPENFINDICKVACLILEDGLDYRFIHKSVREYYCASFLKRQPEELVKVFYSSLLKNSYYEWNEVLNFCEEIDNYRVRKYFSLPQIKSVLTESGIFKNGQFKGLKDSFFSDLCSNYDIGISLTNFTVQNGRWTDATHVFAFPDFSINVFRQVAAILNNNIPKIKVIITQEEKPNEEDLIMVVTDDESNVSINLPYLTSQLDIYSEIKDAVDLIYLEIYELSKQMESTLDSRTQNTALFEV